MPHDRLHEALSWNAPLDVRLYLADPATPNCPEAEVLQFSDTGQKLGRAPGAGFTKYIAYATLYVMSGQGDFMSTAEASRQLGVSARQVQRLAANGTIAQVGSVGRVKLLDARSIQQLKIQKAGRGRPWTQESIALALQLLSTGKATTGTSVEQSRTRKRLERITAEGLVQAMRRRAAVRRYRASESFLDQVTQGVTLTGTSAIDADSELAHDFGLAGKLDRSVDGYISEKQAKQLIRSTHLVEDATGNVTLRVTDMKVLLEGRFKSLVVALDLAESLDARQRAAGLRFITESLEAFR